MGDGLIGGFTDRVTGARYVTTDGSGEYEANVESGGGTTTLTPSKTGYSFAPDELTVRRNAGTVSGIDFTGSSYATITGTVMADGAALEGATVTATSGTKSDSDTSDRRGRFSVSVPAGTITITASKAGYNFGTQTIFADAGETTAIGPIEATGDLMPLNVEASRDTANDGSYNGSVTVAWDQGVDGAADAYQAQRLGDDDETWANFGAIVADTELTGGKGSVSDAAADSDTLTVTVRVLALTEDPDNAGSYTDTLASAPATVGPVNPEVSNVAASRNTDAEPDSLSVTWDARGDANSHWRVLVKFGAEDEWYVMTAAATGGHAFVLANNFTQLNEVGPGTGTKTPDADDWDGVLTFRVDYRQRTQDGAGADKEWTVGLTASVDEK